MIVVHHLENSRSQRILWLLEELGVDYEVKRYDRNPQTSLAPAELKAVHPLGKSPVITDGATTVAETGAIIEYLVDKFAKGRLIPAAGTSERLRYTYWMHAAEGTYMPFVVMSLIFNRIETTAPWIIRPIAKAIAGQVRSGYLGPSIDATLAYAESELASRDWFAGADLTAADVMMSFPLEAADARGLVTAKHPKLAAFLRRIHERPAYTRALERGGPYTILTG